MANLLTPMGSNPKTRKRLDTCSFEGAILHLLAASEGPSALGLPGTVCPAARINRCETACLVWQGRGRMNSVYKGRLRKTSLFLENPAAFLDQLRKELRNLRNRARRKNYTAIARLDGTSDLGLAERFAPEFLRIQFYDYTKVVQRVYRARKHHNWHVTFSRGAGNEQTALQLLHERACNVAAVFRVRKGEPLPKEWRGFPVIDGDIHDFRFLDSPRAGAVVGLRAKGSAYRDTSGFVVD